jgi:hypothetical protein
MVPSTRARSLGSRTLRGCALTARAERHTAPRQRQTARPREAKFVGCESTIFDCHHSGNPAQAADQRWAKRKVCRAGIIVDTEREAALTRHRDEVLEDLVIVQRRV